MALTDLAAERESILGKRIAEFTEGSIGILVAIKTIAARFHHAASACFVLHGFRAHAAEEQLCA